MLSKILILGIVLSSFVFADSEVIVFDDMVKKDKKVYVKSKKRTKRATPVHRAKKVPKYFYIDEYGNERALKKPFVRTNSVETTTKMFIDKPVLKKR